MNRILPFLTDGRVRRTVTRAIKESTYLRHVRRVQPETRLWFRDEGTLPEFLIIGAQRSGSTFLHDTLARRTSAVPSPMQKEVHYFDNKYYRSIGWYARFFESLSGRSPTAKNFEASPYYLYHPAVPTRVRETLPHVKLVAVLRNPVERAVSQYRWMRQVDLEARDAAEAFEYDARRVSLETDKAYLERFEDPLSFDFDHIHRGYIRRSLYHVQLERWAAEFPKEKLLIVSSSAMFDETEAVLEDLTDFLGLEMREDNSERGGVNKNESTEKVEVSPEARRVVRDSVQEVYSHIRDHFRNRFLGNLDDLRVR
jgi:hypothetical protein